MITYIFTRIQHCSKCHKRFSDYLLTEQERKCIDCFVEETSDRLIELVKLQLNGKTN